MFIKKKTQCILQSVYLKRFESKFVKSGRFYCKRHAEELDVVATARRVGSAVAGINSALTIDS